MKKALGIAFVALLISAPAFAQKVAIDYAHDYDFDTVETFEYVDTEESNSSNELMARRIETMIKQKLVEGGLTEVTENPDIYVTYHFTTSERRSYNTTSFGYGGRWGGWYGWGGPGVASYSTQERTYTDGTLIIDAYDSSEKKMIWRGTGTVTVKSNPEKQVRQIEKILKKLGKRWAKILKGQGK